MKTSCPVIALLVFGLAGSQAQNTTAPLTQQDTPLPAPTERRVVDRGANHRLWQWETYEKSPKGQITPRVHRYTELATGMHYQDANGQWQESQELIESYPGGAVARQGQHQVIFANNLNSYGAIDLQTPDGKRLRSNILGLMYVDTATGDAVMIARLQDSAGQLVSPNQVLYTNAFDGVMADVRYSYKRSGFEQDVVLREQPPSPSSYGLNPDTTVLEVVTEFINPPPAVITELGDPSGDEMDENVNWGVSSIGHGKAFDLAGQQSIRSHVPVKKKYVNLQGRYFLIERVRMINIQAQLTCLPVQASVRSHLPVMVSKQPEFPKAPLARLDTRPMKLAKAAPADKGYVLDYVTLNAGQTNFTFQGDMTYYVSAECNLTGTTTVEGGTVVKLNGSGQIDIDQNGTLVCKTGPYRPAIFTSVNDNTMGEQIGSGTPAVDDVNTFLLINPTNVSIHDLRFCFGLTTINHNWANAPSLLDVWNCQFLSGNTAVYGHNVSLHNVLIGRLVNSGAAFIVEGTSFTAENVTADYGYALVEPSDPGATVALTNCLVTRQPLIAAGYAPALQTNSTAWLPSPSSPVYQVVGGGSYYLTNGSPYRDVGTTNINSGMRTHLANKTTYPPAVFSGVTFSVSTNLIPQATRDTNTPDIGYHYDPLDYVFGGCDLFTNLTLTAGTAIGWYEDYGNVESSGQPYGLSLNDGAVFTAAGNASQPCWIARHNTVQESLNGAWNNRGWMSGLMFNGSGASPLPQLNGQFTKWSAPQGFGGYCRDNWNYGVGYFSNCEFFNSGFSSYAPSLYWTNCLLFRTSIAFWSQTASGSFTFQNCTYDEGMLAVCRGYWQDPDTNTIWRIKNTAFNGTGFNWYDCFDGDTNYTDFDFNAYNTNNLSWQTYPFPYPPVYGILEATGTHDVMVTNYNWQSSCLGDFYLPTNSALINAGSTNASLLGMYHSTTQTNQTKETNSTVDIGYHYVAAGADAGPLDTDGDGIPDYLEDANGDGIYGSGDLGDWTDYYNGVLPSLVIVSGDNQNGQTNSFLPLPLTVILTGTNNNALPSAPLIFTVTAGEALIAATTNDTPTNSLNLRTDANGHAAVYALMPSTWQSLNRITATASSGTNSIQTIFTASALQGIQVWLRADAGVTNNVGAISAWGDQSGNANNALQGTASLQPVYATNVLNGHPVVRFDGTNDQLMLAVCPATNNFTVFAVAQTFIGEEIDPENNSYYADGGLTGQHYLFGGNINFNSFGETGLSIGTNGLSVYEYGRNDYGSDHFGSLSVYNGHVGSGFVIVGMSYSNQVPRLYQNGALVHTGISSSRSQSVMARAIGYGSTGYGASPFSGDVAEILVFDRRLTPDERSSVEAYLNAKYAVVPVAPTAPTNLISYAMSSNQIALAWSNQAANATCFKIERKQGSGGTYQQVAAVGGATSYFDSGLVSGTQYYYRVRAGNLAGDSSYSNETNATTLAEGVSLPFADLSVWLEADASVNVNGDGSGLVNGWHDQSGKANNALQITPSQQPILVANAINGRPAVRFDGTNDQLMLTGFPATNNFTVFAVARTTVSEEIDAEDSSYYASGGYTGQHYLFGGNINFNGYGEAGLSLGTNGLSAYEYGRNDYGSDHFGSLSVYNGAVGGAFSIIGMAYSNQVPSLYLNGALVHTGIPSSRSQSVMAKAIGYGSTGYGASPFNGDVAEILIFNRRLTADEQSSVEAYLNAKYAVMPVAPATPANLVSHAVSSNQIALAWSDTATNATCFKIERKQGVSGEYQQIAIVNGGTTAYLDSGLAAGTEFYYRVHAGNLAGDSGYSNETNATTSVGGTSLPLADLSVWLEADASVNVNGDGSGLVNGWHDQSGKANNALQITSSQQPALMANAINGRPVVRFDGTNDQLMLASFPATNNFTVFAVTRTTVGEEIDAEDNGYYARGGAGGQHYLFGGISQHEVYGEVGLSLGTNGISAYEYGYNDYGQNHWGSLSVYNGAVGGAFSIIGMAYSNQVPSLYENGALVHTGISSSRPQSVMSRAIGYGNADSSQQPFVGDVAEILMFNRRLTPEEVYTVGNYLNQKYAMVTNVPPAPVNLTATAVGSAQVNLTWSNTSLVFIKTKLERKTDLNGTYSLVAELGSDVTNYADSSLASGHRYFYRVRVSNLAGDSPYSNEAGVILNLPPTVSLTAPTNGAVFISPANIALEAAATDTDGTVVNVSFFEGGTTSLGTATNSPFSLTWSNVPTGAYSLTANATDNLGGITNSTPVAITVSNPPPSVALTSPTNTQFYFAPAVITLAADASDTNGTISKVDFFYRATNRIATLTSGPYTLTWTNLTSGSYPLTAVATDNEGVTSTSSVVNITVSNTPPTISITSPTNNALFQTPGIVPLTVTAGDVNGAVVKVEYFYRGTNKFGESVSSPFSLVWYDAPAGTNSITAVATDDGGATMTSSAITVIVNAQPSVSITNPVGGSTFAAQANVTINATAADSDGTISRVDFYYGVNNFIGSDATTPYSIVLTNAPSGTYPLTAKATDNRGGVTISSPVTVIVGTNLNDIADSYVRSGSSTNSNFGTATALLVQTNATAGNRSDTYFKFDLSEVANVAGAKLYFYAAVSANNNTLGVTVCGTGTNWTETGITWNNRPALGAVIGSTNITGKTAAWYALDVGGYLQAQKAAGSNVVSLALHATNATSAYVSINSKEATANKPYLQLFTTNVPPTVSILAPTNNTVFIPSTNITITTSASDLDGGIYQVEFFQGATSLGILTNAPYSMTWTNIPFGLYVLTAVATDNLGTKTTSSPVNFNADSSYNDLDQDSDGLSNMEEWFLGTSPQTNNVSIMGNGLIQIHTPLK